MQKMICPRCDSEIDYGLRACPYCGLGFKYAENHADNNRNDARQRNNKTYDMPTHTQDKTYERRQQELNVIKHTKERRNNKSGAKRVTASSLCIMFGAMGLHNFYLGQFLKGTLRLVLFLLCCGFFFSPIIASIINTGTIKFLFDGYGIFGICMMLVNIISYMLALVEFVRLVLGVTNVDAKGYNLR